MEPKVCPMRQCSVWRRRCDHAPSLEPELRSMTPPAPHRVYHAPDHTGAPVLAVKTECDTEVVAPQEWHTELTCLPDHTETDIEQANTLVMMTDEEANIKQELDVGPTVLTPQGARRTRLGTNARPGPGGAAPALQTTFLQTVLNTKVEDNYDEEHLGVGSDSSLVLDMRGKGYGFQESHQPRCDGPLSEYSCLTDESRAKAHTQSSGKSFHCEHMRTHTSVKPCKCERCEYSASQLQHLKRHKRTHTGERSYKCDQCEYSSSRLGNLKNHMRTHTGEKPYKCEQCGYSTSDSSTLKRHMRTHTGEKPYKCEQCEYSASQSSSLKKHMRNHTGEKPYKCKQCKYSASVLGHLRIHMRTHTGEKPYKCVQCEYSASHLRSLNRHMRTHTGEKPYKCE